MQYAGLELHQVEKPWIDGSSGLYFEDHGLAKRWYDLYIEQQPERTINNIRYYNYEREEDRLRAEFTAKHNLVQKDAFDTRFGKLISPHHKAKSIEWGKTGKHASPATEWFDHDELFWDRTNKRYVLTTQPYDVSLERFKLLEKYCQERGLELSISYTEAWHYQGLCPLITIFGRPVKRNVN